MKIIIIDDTQTAIDDLTVKLGKYQDIEIAGTAHNGTDGLALLSNTIPDLIFLDVEMPDMTGIEFLDMMKGRIGNNCHVVIYTAYDDYILSAFRNKAFDFLLKPVDESELNTVMRRFYSERINNNDTKDTTVQDSNGIGSNKLLIYTNSVDFRFSDIRDICLFRYNHDVRVWEVVMANKEIPIRLKRNTTNEILLQLAPNFIQVHQKYIININYLMEVVDNKCHFYPPFDNIDYVKVGCFFRKKLITRFNSL